MRLQERLVLTPGATPLRVHEGTFGVPWRATFDGDDLDSVLVTADVGNVRLVEDEPASKVAVDVGPADSLTLFLSTAKSTSVSLNGEATGSLRG